MNRPVHISLSHALSKGPPPEGNLAIPVFSQDLLDVEIYAPEGSDLQKPHSRDEVYFVTRGTGLFFDGEQRHPIEAGPFIFVHAGCLHRFEDFSTDFVVWVLFYGSDPRRTAPTSPAR